MTLIVAIHADVDEENPRKLNVQIETVLTTEQFYRLLEDILAGKDSPVTSVLDWRTGES